MDEKSKEKTDRKKIKEERFKRIASRRVKETLNKLRLLRNCANKANYSYTEYQVKKIINAIDEEWKKVKVEFSNSKQKHEDFKL